MRFVARFDQFERRPELHRKARAVMTLHWQAAALLRAAERKRRNDDVAAGRNRRPQALDVSSPVAGLGQEVKRRPIVP
ncbi:hypothetical protein ACVWW3_006412 [Bradyrhizobium sp. LM2.9]